MSHVFDGIVWDSGRKRHINFAVFDRHDGVFELQTTIFGIPGITVETLLTRDGVEFMRDNVIDKEVLWIDFPNQNLAGPWYSSASQIAQSLGFRVPENRRNRNGNREGNGRNGNREYNALYRTTQRLRTQALQRRANSRSRRRASGIAGNRRPSVGID